jgi:hypothetical protein
MYSGKALRLRIVLAFTAVLQATSALAQSAELQDNILLVPEITSA